ncbi:penicillin-binding transpeptidase domain-containing protein [Clostridium sp. UBA4548]|uniref:penicillin-binding transpeptidase domain-containing protein n=1 Tax=Clostridium sp. UBA4548 TaxID=1946361 RepID=UPI0025C40B78|nr:penicillin-binding transpeptidase domain-containing protein [Clostridium sp. UBA4548]
MVNKKVGNNKKNKTKFSRFNIFFIAMGLIFTTIIGRLLYLQVIMVEEYREEANKKASKNVPKVAARGDIIDAKGEVLATSKQSYSLMFTQTEESKDKFFETMAEVFKILDNNKIYMVDEFPIVIENNNLVFKFKATDEESKRWMEIRFKKDRGIEDNLIGKHFEDKKKEELTKEEQQFIDEEILKVSPQQVFDKLLEEYKIDKSYALQEQRKYMIVKDSIKMQSFSGYKPVIIANNLSQEAAFEFEQRKASLPGIAVETQPMRTYPNKELGSAFLGYISKINPWEKEKFEEKGYDISTDNVGKSGLEAALEPYLKGTKGQEIIEVNKSGRKVKTIVEADSYPGKTVQLNIDKNIQKAAEDALDDTMKDMQKKGTMGTSNVSNATRGAAVVLNAKTGQVLALVSRPGYDPNTFTVPGLLTPELSEKYFNPNLEQMGKEYIAKKGLINKKGVLTDKEMGLPAAERAKILLDRMFPIDTSIEGNTTIRQDIYDIFPKPFYNYASLSLIPPGSIFKPVTALAGLTEGVITPSEKILDNGYYNKRYADYKGACWKFNQSHGSHGAIDVAKALEVSCNYYFYDVADRLYDKYGENPAALDIIAKYAWKFGLGVPPNSGLEPTTGIEIAENFGQVYNYESSKRSQSSVYINQLVEFLNKGSNSLNAQSNQYKPFNIVKEKEYGTPKEIAEIKKINEKKSNLIEAIKAEMTKENKSSDKEIGQIMEPLIKEVINASPQAKAIGYTKDDIDGIILAIIFSTNDARTFISSAANAYNASIGQGMNFFTPLQLASYMATLVNGGNRYELQLVNKIIDPVTGETTEFKPKLMEHVDIEEKYLATIKKGMKDVTSGDNGTAVNAFRGFPIENGGKTGSANVNVVVEEAIDRTAYGTYLGFAPYDNPEIVTCVVIFDGGSGGYGAPVARAVFEEYFRDKIKAQNPAYKFMYNRDEKVDNAGNVIDESKKGESTNGESTTNNTTGNTPNSTSNNPANNMTNNSRGN